MPRDRAHRSVTEPCHEQSGIGFTLRAAAVHFPGRTALEGLDLRIDPGAKVALIGPSGAGKTTLLRLLAGTVQPSEGQLSDTTGLPQKSRLSCTGFIHQDHALVPVLRVLQNVLAGRLGRFGSLKGLRSVYFPSKAEIEEVHQTLMRVGIGELLYHRTDRLSGGERQRVAIARALYQEPRVFLCDEPVASLDPARSRDVVQLLIDLAGESGATLVTSLHDERLASKYFDRVIGLRAGRVVLDSTREEGRGHTALSAAALEELYGLDHAPRTMP